MGIILKVEEEEMLSYRKKFVSVETFKNKTKMILLFYLFVMRNISLCDF